MTELAEAVLLSALTLPLLSVNLSIVFFQRFRPDLAASFPSVSDRWSHLPRHPAIPVWSVPAFLFFFETILEMEPVFQPFRSVWYCNRLPGKMPYTGHPDNVGKWI